MEQNNAQFPMEWVLPPVPTGMTPRVWVVFVIPYGALFTLGPVLLVAALLHGQAAQLGPALLGLAPLAVMMSAGTWMRPSRRARRSGAPAPENLHARDDSHRRIVLSEGGISLAGVSLLEWERFAGYRCEDAAPPRYRVLVRRPPGRSRFRRSDLKGLLWFAVLLAGCGVAGYAAMAGIRQSGTAEAGLLAVCIAQASLIPLLHLLAGPLWRYLRPPKGARPWLTFEAHPDEAPRDDVVALLDRHLPRLDADTGASD